ILPDAQRELPFRRIDGDVELLALQGAEVIELRIELARELIAGEVHAGELIADAVQLVARPRRGLEQERGFLANDLALIARGDERRGGNCEEQQIEPERRPWPFSPLRLLAKQG